MNESIFNNIYFLLKGMWSYPIEKKFQPEYNKNQARSLWEFSYNVLLKNEDPKIPIIPPNFDKVISLDNRFENVGYFFISTNLKIILIAMSGTYSRLEEIQDIYYRQVVPDKITPIKEIYVHNGFYSMYLTIRDQLLKLMADFYTPEHQVIITGLSLGGATSTLAIYDLSHKYNDIIHYSFASPRVFNEIGANDFNHLVKNSYRICNWSDLVTNLPPPIIFEDVFQHVGEAINFDTNLTDTWNNHITAYRLYVTN